MKVSILILMFINISTRCLSTQPPLVETTRRRRSWVERYNCHHCDCLHFHNCHHYHHCDCQHFHNCHHYHQCDCHHRHHYQQFWLKVREVEVTEDEAHSSQMPVIFIIINTIFINIITITAIFIATATTTLIAIFIAIKASIAIVTTVDIFIISTVFIIITLLIILTFLTIVKIATLIVMRWFFRVSPIYYDKWIN